MWLSGIANCSSISRSAETDAFTKTSGPEPSSVEVSLSHLSPGSCPLLSNNQPQPSVCLSQAMRITSISAAGGSTTICRRVRVAAATYSCGVATGTSTTNMIIGVTSDSAQTRWRQQMMRYRDPLSVTSALSAQVSSTTGLVSSYMVKVEVLTGKMFSQKDCRSERNSWNKC